jgi:hypothetical protein
LTGAAEVHAFAALFFLAVLAGAVIGLWRTVGESLPLIIAALGPIRSEPNERHALITATA